MDFMIDLETLGQSPGCVVLSLGVVPFGPRVSAPGRDTGLYLKLHVKKQHEIGMTEDQDTVEWWSKQGDAAQDVLRASVLDVEPDDACEKLNRFLSERCQQSKIRMWANGADFDLPIIIALYKAVDLKPAWRYYNHRCYRTLKALAPMMCQTAGFDGVPHHALDDAVHQARNANEMLRFFASKE